MTTYERSVWVDAPLAAVWEFHSGVSGLEALTPDWFHLRVDAVLGPDGERDPAVLASGAEIRASVRPLGVGPRQRWTSRIVARGREDGTAYFRDVMDDGPFPEWEHTHLFYGDGDRTLVRDHVEYSLPGGELGRRVAPLAVVGFDPMFRYRHHRTKALLE
ncbi:SRPBCC family protein [Halobacteriales archaeon Cl-PHB]